MSLPNTVEYLVIGAGIHGLSTAWHLAECFVNSGESVKGRIVVIDKADEVAAGASGIACGVVRNNYFQPAMRKLMMHSVNVWESDPQVFAYKSVGYMQVSCAAMRDNIKQIYEEQKAIGYESVFVDGAANSRKYMLNLFDDWQAKNIDCILHEKKGGYANNKRSMHGLAKKATDLGVEIITGVEVLGFISKSASKTITAVETSKGVINCEKVIIGAGPWIRDFWKMLGLPDKIEVKNLKGEVHNDVDMWRFWQLEEGVLEVAPETLLTNNNKMPPVIHVDTDAPLYSTIDGKLITDKMWGIYYKPDWDFGGVQGGASPYQIAMNANDVMIDPYGHASKEFIASKKFSEMWVSALAHCHKRFEGKMDKYRDEPSGGIGCFTADSFPIIDTFNNNVVIIADSNHGYKMLGLGCLVAEEILGNKQELLEPFRFSRFKKGKLHPVSNSPYPWS